jgi:hypothetical protein
MHKGFLKALLYYLVGLGLAGLSYWLTIGQEYVHAPGPHHIIIFLTFAGGFIWLLAASAWYFTGNRTENLKGIIFTNLFMTAGFTLFMLYIIKDGPDDSEFEENMDQITIEESGDTTTIFHGGSPVYFKVKDSVLLNFIDSTKINWNEVGRIKK